MARAPIPEIVLKPLGFGRLAAAAGASVQVNLRSGGAASVYSAETGGSVLSNPLTSDAQGRVTGWVDRGAYNLVVTHTDLPGGGYTAFFDAAPGGNATIDSAWLAPGVGAGGGGGGLDIVTRSFLGFDRFDRATGPLVNSPVAVSGQSWTVQAATVSTNVVMQDGVLLYLGDGSNRQYIALHDEPGEITTEIVFFPPSAGQSSGTAAFILSNSTSGSALTLALNSLHLVISPTSFALAFYEGATHSPSDFIRSISFVVDGVTRNRVRMRRTAPDEVLVSANDSSFFFRDPRIARLWGTKLVLQHYQTALEPGKVGFAGVTAQ
jgi:hypothetical protein